MIKGGKFTYYANITSALQRLERIAKVNCIDKIELKNCLFSRAPLSNLSLVLLPRDYEIWIGEMTKQDLDYKNPAGIAAFNNHIQEPVYY